MGRGALWRDNQQSTFAHIHTSSSHSTTSPWSPIPYPHCVSTPRSARARGPASQETGRGTPTPSAPGGHRTSRHPADVAGAPPRVPHFIRRHAVEAPRRGETVGGDPSAGRRFPPVAAPGCLAPGCRARAPPPCEPGTTPGACLTWAAVASPTRAADCLPVIPGRRPGTRIQRASLTRPTPRPTRPAPPRYRCP